MAKRKYRKRDEPYIAYVKHYIDYFNANKMASPLMSKTAFEREYADRRNMGERNPIRSIAGDQRALSGKQAKFLYDIAKASGEPKKLEDIKKSMSGRNQFKDVRLKNMSTILEEGGTRIYINPKTGEAITYTEADYREEEGDSDAVRAQKKKVLRRLARPQSP